jgi:adenine phosphoribosyltransferase
MFLAFSYGQPESTWPENAPMTGGTAIAAIHLLRRLGVSCDQAFFVFDLIGLHGREMLADEGVRVITLHSLPMRG